MPLRWEILGIRLQDEPIVAVGTGLLAELYQVVDGRTRYVHTSVRPPGK
jgi:hypothetical protein